MTDTLRTIVNEVLQGRRLLEHPFYRRWESGDLTPGELKAYAEQYRFFEAMLPDFLSELAGRLPDGTARTLVESNLNDEVATPSHLDLFGAFAAHYGAEDVDASPAMQSLMSAYRGVLDAGPICGLAGLLAYEVQGAEIAESKAAGLARHYGASEEALEFWRTHGSIEVDHAQWTLDALESLNADDAVVRRSMTEVAAAWWSFLDERDALVAA
jgi:pyrroloquinoline-quinone synthase